LEYKLIEEKWKDIEGKYQHGYHIDFETEFAILFHFCETMKDKGFFMG